MDIPENMEVRYYAEEMNGRYVHYWNDSVAFGSFISQNTNSETTKRRRRDLEDNEGPVPELVYTSNEYFPYEQMITLPDNTRDWSLQAILKKGDGSENSILSLDGTIDMDSLLDLDAREEAQRYHTGEDVGMTALLKNMDDQIRLILAHEVGVNHRTRRSSDAPETNFGINVHILTPGRMITRKGNLIHGHIFFIANLIYIL